MKNFKKPSAQPPEKDMVRKLVDAEVKKILRRKKKAQSHEECLKTIEEHSEHDGKALEALRDPEFRHPV